MTEGRRIDERPDPEVARIVFSSVGVSLADSEDAWRGEESIGWRGTSQDGDRFVQLFPPTRGVAELEWCNSVARAASTAAPACVVATPSLDGRVALATPAGPVMVFPFVDGTHPDAGEVSAREVAELLATLHGGIAAAWSGPPKPRTAVAPVAGIGREDLLADRELDGWEHSLRARPATLPIHGDFYGGNIFVRGGQVVGVIDWSDSDIEHGEQEVAWATWEFCQNGGGDDLVDARAEVFLGTYLDAGGPASVAKPFDPLPWIRRRLRMEARMWFSDPRSESERSDYHEAQLRAFERLRTRHLPGR